MFAETLNKVLKQHRQQDRKLQYNFIKRKQNSFHINSVFRFSKICDSKNYYILTFTCFIQVLRAQFRKSGIRAGVQTP